MSKTPIDPIVDSCDICSEKFYFSVGVIYYINDEPKFLCPGCAEKQENLGFRKEYPK